jgi:hypothetical protein
MPQMKFWASVFALMILITACAGATSDSPLNKVTGCSRGMEQSTKLNGAALFDAAGGCAVEGMSFEATFLLIAGQIRSMADLSVLRPAGDADEITMGKLYGRIFYRTGGAGPDSIYRDPIQTKQLFDRIEKWVPKLFDGYNPGWRYKALGKNSPAYAETVSELKAHRVAQLQSYARLISNDDYYKTKQRLDEILRRNRGVTYSGTADARQVDELTKEMARIERTLALPPSKPTPSKPFRFEPDPDANYKHLHTGFNGPARPELVQLRSAKEARESWIAKALGVKELDSLLSQVDFRTQLLITLAIGKRTTATGSLFITNVSFNAIRESLHVAARIGVNEKDCDFPPAVSYPFALVIAKRPGKEIDSQG